MFHYDDGLRLTSIDLAIDFRRRQPRGFISHAHADHMAPHELAFCTPITSRLYQHRLGHRMVHELPFREPFEWSDTRLTTFPAGHVLGSAMLLAELGGKSLLYTGDFKLTPSATAEAAELPRADVLIMESTFGDPRYRLPQRERVVAELLSVVRTALSVGIAPVIQAYVLGKSQEVTKVLTSHGLRVQQHPDIFPISQLYESCGCLLGDFSQYTGDWAGDSVIIVPPRGQRAAKLNLPTRCVTIGVTGWAADERAKFRLGVDYAIPFSDHADYDELFECVRRVQPRVIYCTHGPAEFVDHLRDAGFDARLLNGPRQQRLF